MVVLVFFQKVINPLKLLKSYLILNIAGGSHDRTDLLPLKAGVSIMALGAMSANPGLEVQIVPVGLSYFHAHKFRSRAVIEFGTPRAVPRDLISLFDQGGDQKRESCNQLLDIIYDGLKSVTVQAPDYETLMVSQNKYLFNLHLIFYKGYSSW